MPAATSAHPETSARHADFHTDRRVLLLRRSILAEKLDRRGQHIAREYSADVWEVMRGAEGRERTPPVVPASMTVADLTALIDEPGPVLEVHRVRFPIPHSTNRPPSA